MKHTCTINGCGKTFDKPHGLLVHQRRIHRDVPLSEARVNVGDKPISSRRRRKPAKPKASATKRPAARTKKPDVDTLFERVGKATDILFPNGVPSARILEVAELQKAMLEVAVR